MIIEQTAEYTESDEKRQFIAHMKFKLPVINDKTYCGAIRLKSIDLSYTPVDL